MRRQLKKRFWRFQMLLVSLKDLHFIHQAHISQVNETHHPLLFFQQISLKSFYQFLDSDRKSRGLWNSSFYSWLVFCARFYSPFIINSVPSDSPHIGLYQNAERFKSFGLKAWIETEHVLLSYPNKKAQLRLLQPTQYIKFILWIELFIQKSLVSHLFRLNFFFQIWSENGRKLHFTRSDFQWFTNCSNFQRLCSKWEYHWRIGTFQLQNHFYFLSFHSY